MKNPFKPLPATIAALIIAGVIAHAANYQATQGSGTTFQATDNAGVLLPAFSLANTGGTDIGASILTAVQSAIPAGANAIGIVAVRQNNQIRSIVISGTAAISASAIAAQGSGVRFAMTDFSCSNSGSSTTPVLFLDGNAAGALPIWQSIIPAAGGTNKSFATSVSTTANTALIISTTVASTTVYCSVAGYTGT